VRRETRINLIFLTAFVIFALPGAVILFRKKLDPSAHRLDQPDPVVSRLPYMSPLPAPPGVKWVVPDRTQAWVRSLTAPVPTLSAAPPGPQWEAVISPDHFLQVLTLQQTDSGNDLTMLFWRDIPDPRDSDFTVTVDGQMSNVTRVKSTPVPAEVRHELVMAGFVRPPKDVTILKVKLPPQSHDPRRLELVCSRPDFPLRSTVEFPQAAR